MGKQYGKFITFEGIDGAGKSTHLQWLKKWLAIRNIRYFFTREPGGTPLAEDLRSLLLSRTMDSETETLLLFAARQSHINEVIIPHLEQGTWVISDRFTDATYAYQGGGRSVSSERIAVLESWVHNGFQPDLTVLLDIEVEVSKARLQLNRQLDRFEQEKEDFFNRVRASYEKRWKQFPQRIMRIDATQPILSIQQELDKVFSQYLIEAKQIK